ncbi:MAG: hypothetical protein M1168_02745 [Candidatus Marsarchaeota archaeon]|nr:hypothetical protein [Candidatus Marsarchaeota archaeon]MCL5094874.1 hypothetical protein [Candidatus Marsarchaeota archaeon]
MHKQKLVEEKEINNPLIETAYYKSKKIIEDILGIEIKNRPKIIFKNIDESLEAYFKENSKKIIINKKHAELYKDYFSSRLFKITLTHELIHYAQKTEKITNNDGKNISYFNTLMQKIKNLNLDEKLNSGNYDLIVSRKLKDCVDFKEINSLGKYLSQKSINEALAKFIEPVVLSNDIKDANKIRIKIFEYFFIRDEKVDKDQKTLLKLHYFIRSENKQKHAARQIQYLLPLTFITERGSIGEKIALLAFIKNDFIILKTAKFLFRPWEEILNDLIKNNNQLKHEFEIKIKNIKKFIH